MANECFVHNCQKDATAKFSNRDFCLFHSKSAQAIAELHPKFFEDNKDRFRLIFSESDQNFIFSHLDGCMAVELVNQIGCVGNSTITVHLQKNKIKGIKNIAKSMGQIGQYWLINVPEIIRVLDIYRNWVSTYCVAKKFNYPLRTFLNYALKEFFGPVKKNLSGRCCIHISWLDNVSQLKKIMGKRTNSRQRGRRALAEKLRKGLICACDFADFVGVSQNTVSNWIKKGWLKTQKNKRVYLLTLQKTEEFIFAVRRGEIPLRKNIAEKISCITPQSLRQLFP